jgi:hypothetical protein
MQKYNNIKALFFLGIFSMFLLHQVVPHMHHQHDEVEHTHDNIAHSDNNNHHHDDIAHNDNHNHDHDISKKRNLIKGFLDGFIDMHVHSVVSNEILLTHQSSVKLLNIKKDISTPVSVVHFHSSLNYDEAEKIKVYRPPNNYFNSYLSSLDSRGPPSLG